MKIIKLNATDSTNNYLKKISRESSLEDETVVWAEHQTAGRGQRGSQWFSEAGKSLTFSMFKRFSTLKAEEQFLINIMVSIAIRESLIKLKVPETTIKWPNDIMSGNKKIAGVLIENTLKREFIKHTVIGIGINVNNDFENYPKIGSMKSQSKINYKIIEVLTEIVERCLFYLNKIENTEFLHIKEEYENNLFYLNKKSKFKSKDNIFEACIIGITNSGELVLKKSDGDLKQIQIKEVQLLY